MNHVLLFAFGIGVVAGLRSMTAPAMTAWAAKFGWLHLYDSSLSFIGSKLAVLLLSLAAIGELIADKLPFIGKRTALVPLLARVFTGAFCGAAFCVSARESVIFGILFGAIGALAGAFGGYELRRRLPYTFNVHDIVIALPEDLIAIALALIFVKF
jgi:uncharacterized membrane protein